MTDLAISQSGAVGPPAHERAVTDDGALVRRAQNGDRAAYGQLVGRYERRILAIARRVVSGGEAAAEDVAQDAFLRAWRTLDRFDATRPFGPWIVTIAVRIARTHGRSARRRLRLARGAAGQSPPAATAMNRAADPAEAARTRESQGHVWDVVDRVLAPDARLALWLVHGEQLSSPEVGRLLGRTDASVRQLLKRARTTLRPHLESEFRDVD